MRDEPLEELALEVVDVDEATPGAGGVVHLVRLLDGVGHVELVAQVLDVERRVALGDLAVEERAGPVDLVELGVEDVDRGGVEVRRVEPVAARAGREGQALVDRVLDRDPIWALVEGPGRARPHSSP